MFCTTLRPTLPLTQEEVVRTLATVEKYKEATSSNGMENARRLRGLVLLLRYSGMRISDPVQMKDDRINGKRLFSICRRQASRRKFFCEISS